MKSFTCVTFAILLFAQLSAYGDKPNVVLIISDDQRFTDYGFMGHESIKTPNLDQLAKESTVFRRGYVPTALCRPSLLTIATGRYAHEHCTGGNDPWIEKNRRGSDEYKARRRTMIDHVDKFPTIADILGEQGYVSHQSGKWWEGKYDRGGFTEGMTLGFGNHKNGRHGDEGLKIGRQTMKPVFEFMNEAVQSKKPFLVWYAPFLPHTPHNPAPERVAKYRGKDNSVPLKEAKYHAMCEWFDETCGQLLSKIDDLGVRDNTLVVYVCDNGWVTAVKELGNKPQGWTRGFAPRSKQSPFESGTRTPIMYRWPGKIAAQDRPELASSIDILPTVLSAAGVDAPDGLPGLNLMAALREKSPIERNRIFGESFDHDQSDLNNTEATLAYRWCIQDNWKLLLSYQGELPGRYPEIHKLMQGKPRLYDLSKDPLEQTNLIEQHADLAAELRKHIDDWYAVKKPVME
ncbi:MAG: sulfatase [Planctomycetota bacterium]